MVWALCTTHGPIQDADAVERDGEVVRLVCVCGLDCESYEPTGFVEHEELKELAEEHRQPREDHEEPEAPALSEDTEEE